MSTLFTCTAMLLGLAFIGVGAAVLRKANPMSGYLFIGAGAIMFLMRCCLGFSSFENLIEAGVDYDMLQLVMLIKTLFRSGEMILVAILLAVALVGLAKKVPANPAP